MTAFENLSPSEKIRAALYRDVRAIGTEACHLLGLEITKPAMEIVAELVYKKLKIYGTDLEAFAKHGKRATINSDDVILLVRRCPSLKSRLNCVAPSPKEKRRKTVSSKAPETPAAKQKESEITTSKQMEIDTISKRKEPSNTTSKRKEMDIGTLHFKETESLASNQNPDVGITEIQNMSTDMIDLTFD